MTTWVKDKGSRIQAQGKEEAGYFCFVSIDHAPRPGKLLHPLVGAVRLSLVSGGDHAGKLFCVGADLRIRPHVVRTRKRPPQKATFLTSMNATWHQYKG